MVNKIYYRIDYYYWYEKEWRPTHEEYKTKIQVRKALQKMRRDYGKNANPIFRSRELRIVRIEVSETVMY